MTAARGVTIRRARLALVGALCVWSLTGCTAGDPVRPPTAPSPTVAGEGHDGPSGAPQGLPSPHVHGVQIDPADERVHLASHDGLFRYDDEGPVRVGPVIDLMGFTVAGPDHFYASGHPGPGVDLPQPVGLIESLDGGATWSPVSRGGVSDFHALTASELGVLGFDGRALLSTADGTSWEQLDPPVPPYSMDVSHDGSVILLTTEQGPIRSDDAGRAWRTVPGAPVIQFVAFAGADVVFGVTPDGAVTRSDDRGLTWAQTATLPEPPQALGAHRSPDGSVTVVAATTEQVLVSTDGAVTFSALG